MSERRNRWLFIVLLVSQLLLLSAQVSSPDGERNQLEALTLRLLAPVAHVVRGGTNTFDDLDRGLRSNAALKSENAGLRGEVQGLRQELRRLQGVESELGRLAGAVSYRPPPEGKLRLADVVYLDPKSWIRSMVLYAPGEPARVNQPVLTTDGLVGRVILVAGPYVKVQLVTDRAAAVGAMIERTRRQGLVRGTGEGLELLYLQADVEEGDTVVTSGIDGVFPRNIPIGTVETVEAGSGLFLEVSLESAVKLDVLDQAYIQAREPLPETVIDDSGVLPGE